jgi:hypothetical protein
MMTLRSTMIAVAGLLTLGVAQVAGAQEPAPSVPPPSTPITPENSGGVLAPEDAAPVAPPPPVVAPQTPPETLPTTPAPVPYGTPGAAAPQSPPPPAPGGFDMGGEMMTPLPPPPPPVEPSTISRGPWRGRGWMSFRMSVTGPVGGELGARPGVLSLGAGGDIGWRINNVVGLGTGLSGQIHSRIRVREVGTNDTTRFNNGMLYWDAGFLRLYAPFKRRFQPYVEIGGGLARLNHHAADATGAVVPMRSYGGQVRAALGLEGWITNTVTLGFAGTYRMNAFRDLPGQGPGWTIGHAMQGVLELGVHW